MHTRRVLLAVAACALASLALTATAEAATPAAAPAKLTGATPAKAKKGVVYEWCYEGSCEYAPLVTYSHHVWAFEGYPGDGGVFAKEGKYTFFHYTESFDTGSELVMTKVKHTKNYIGSFYYWDGEEYILEPGTIELRRT